MIDMNSNGSPFANLTANERLEIRDMALNALLSRQEFLKNFLDERRDIDDECGYPKTNELNAAHYRMLYDREGVATRVVTVLPEESWSSGPKVFEDDDVDTETAFEKAWKDLAKSLRGDSSYESEESNPIWEFLKRVDILSGIGHFGVLLLGFDDGEDMSQPVELVTEKQQSKKRKLLYMRAFDESLVQITRYENDKNDARYSHPNMYQITMSDLDNRHGGIGVEQATLDVHWSRIVHVADSLGSSEIFGVPRMRPVYNRLYDLRKLYGGSAEMYWRGAFPGLSFETNPQNAGDTEIDLAATRAAAENYMNTLQRYLINDGMTVKSISPQMSDPTSQIDTQINAICILLGIPKRIFEGSERGELASSQDAGSWARRMATRQDMYLTPRIIVPFVDRLIQAGVLPRPKQFNVVWGDMAEATDMEKADLAVKQTEALAKYVGGGVDTLFEPMSYLTRILGLEEDEAEAVLKASVKHIEEANPEAEGPFVPGRNPKPPELEGAPGGPPAPGQPPPPGGAPPKPGQPPQGGPPKPGQPPKPKPKPKPGVANAEELRNVINKTLLDEGSELKLSLGDTVQILNHLLGQHPQKSHASGVGAGQKGGFRTVPEGKPVKSRAPGKGTNRRGISERGFDSKGRTVRPPLDKKKSTGLMDTPESLQPKGKVIGKDNRVGDLAPPGKGRRPSAPGERGGAEFSKKTGPVLNPDGQDTMQGFRKHAKGQDPSDPEPKGEWTEGRQKLHDKILGESFAGKTPVAEGERVAYVMGGGPASGKSSIIRSGDVKIDKNTVQINPDDYKLRIPEMNAEIKAGNPGASSFVHEESSHLAKVAQKRGSEGGYNTLLDGTGNSSFDSLKGKVDKMRANGQTIKAHYVTIPTDEAIKRSDIRAEKSRRFVPHSVIRATHAAVSRVVPKAVKEGLFDEFDLWDTSGPFGSKPTHVATAKGKNLTIIDQGKWDSFLAKAE